MIKEIFTKKNILTYANLITLLRLMLFFCMVYLLYIEKRMFALVLFIINLFFDMVDGGVARYFKQRTAFGYLFDTAMDTTFIIFLLLYFYFIGKLSLMFLLFFIMPRLLSPIIIYFIRDVKPVESFLKQATGIILYLLIFALFLDFYTYYFLISFVVIEYIIFILYFIKAYGSS